MLIVSVTLSFILSDAEGGRRSEESPALAMGAAATGPSTTTAGRGFFTPRRRRAFGNGVQNDKGLNFSFSSSYSNSFKAN